MAFGGYNGRYHNAVHVYKPEAASHARHAPAAPAETKAPAAGPTENGIGQKQASAAAPAAPVAPVAASREQQQQQQQQQPPAESHAAPPRPSAAESKASAAELEAAKREAAAAKENAAHELAIMRRQLTSAHAAAAETEKVCAEHCC